MGAAARRRRAGGARGGRLAVALAVHEDAAAALREAEPPDAAGEAAGLQKGAVVFVLSPTGVQRKCTVVDAEAGDVMVHYVGFEDQYDEWLPRDSERIQVVGQKGGGKGSGLGVGKGKGKGKAAGGMFSYSQAADVPDPLAGSVKPVAGELPPSGKGGAAKPRPTRKEKRTPAELEFFFGPQQGSRNPAEVVYDEADDEDNSDDDEPLDWDSVNSPEAADLEEDAEFADDGDDGRQASMDERSRELLESCEALEQSVNSLQRQFVKSEGKEEVAVSADDLQKQASQMRLEVAAEVFHTLGARNSNRLVSEQLLRFASLDGFEGSEADWGKEYKLVCKEQGCSDEEGLDFEAFWRMVNQDSEGGSFCTTRELLDICDKLAGESSTALDGWWVTSDHEEVQISGDKIRWLATEEIWDLESSPEGEVAVWLDGKKYTAELVGNALKWSDGDRWQLVTTTKPKPPRQTRRDRRRAFIESKLTGEEAEEWWERELKIRPWRVDDYRRFMAREGHER